jgi:Fe-S oxidoreductase
MSPRNTAVGESHAAVPAAHRSPLPPETRAARAMAAFAREFGALTALRMESCIHCGMCADACHFYIATEDPKYTPIWKVEPFKQAYKRESGPLAPIYRLLGLKKEVTAAELGQWQELLFDSCNLCGRCSLICPMGIDVAALIEQARHAMFEAGLAPAELHEQAHYQELSGQPWESAEPYRRKLEEIGRTAGVPMPIDLPAAEVLLLVSGFEVDRYPDQVAALARVMAHLGVKATFRSDALFAENMAYFVGATGWQRDIGERVVAAARACGAGTVIVPECGHAYTSLRWEAAELRGAPLPFKVLHVTEFLADALAAGRLKLRKADGGTVTFHDPCQLVRKGGVMEAPRALMAALGLDLREMKNKQGFSFCCAGGGGVMQIPRATPLRHRAVAAKLHEVDATGARSLVTSCSGCRASFEDAAERFHWNQRPASLLELVASHLA